MEPEDTKLNHRIIIHVNRWTKENLVAMAHQVGIAPSVLCRALLNKEIMLLLYEGIENLTLSMVPLKDLRKPLPLKTKTASIKHGKN